MSRRPPGGSTSRSWRLTPTPPGTRHRYATRRALLEQQFSRLDEGITVKSRSHNAVQKRVRDGDNRHALMMRHEGPDNRNTFAVRYAARRVVQRLIEAIPPVGIDGGERGKVAAAACGSTMAASAVA